MVEVDLNSFSLEGETGTGVVSSFLDAREVCLRFSPPDDLTDPDCISSSFSTVGVGLDPSSPGGLGTAGLTCFSLDVVVHDFGAGDISLSEEWRDVVVTEVLIVGEWRGSRRRERPVVACSSTGSKSVRELDSSASRVGLGSSAKWA
jgi:hypothetical protein